MKTNELEAKLASSVTFTFGDSKELCDQLLCLIRLGTKTATCGTLRDFESQDEAMPAVGRQDIALNSDGTPALILETVEVTQQRINDVTESFALAEGENDDLSTHFGRGNQFVMLVEQAMAKTPKNPRKKPRKKPVDTSSFIKHF